MRKSELLRRIEQLEAKVLELEAKPPPQYHYYYSLPSPLSPYSPSEPYGPPVTWSGASVEIVPSVLFNG